MRELILHLYKGVDGKALQEAFIEVLEQENILYTTILTQEQFPSRLCFDIKADTDYKKNTAILNWVRASNEICSITY